jgi:hypothetical protein
MPDIIIRVLTFEEIPLPKTLGSERGDVNRLGFPMHD